MQSGSYLEKILNGEIVDPNHPLSRLKPDKSVSVEEFISNFEIKEDKDEEDDNFNDEVMWNYIPAPTQKRKEPHIDKNLSAVAKRNNTVPSKKPRDANKKAKTETKKKRSLTSSKNTQGQKKRSRMHSSPRKSKNVNYHEDKDKDDDDKGDRG